MTQPADASLTFVSYISGLVLAASVYIGDEPDPMTGLKSVNLTSAGHAIDVLSMLDDPSVPTADAEMERFGYGTTPVPDLAAYATKRELLDRFRDRTARLAAVVAEKHADYFPRPSPEKFHPYSPTIGHIAFTLLVAHPPHHLGQLKQWRRAAGIAEKA